MKTKKTKNANLENLRTIFFQIGTILILSAILVAFEWKSNVKLIPILTTNPGIDILEIDIPRTPPKEEKQVIQPPTPIEKLILVDDTEDIEDEPFFIDTEDNWDDPSNILIFDVPEEVIDEFIKVEFMPTFMGKDGQYFRNYVAQNVKFPVTAIENGIVGKVFASFVIDKDGKVIKVKITRGIHPVVDNAVLDAIESSPEWEPGIQDGKYVKVRYTIAIAFELL